MVDVLQRCNERTHTNDNFFFAESVDRVILRQIIVGAATQSTFWHFKKVK